MNYEKEIENLLTPLPHKLQVRFALDCALDVKHLMAPESIQALDAVEKWLKGEVTQAEIEAVAATASHAAYAAAQSASYAAYAAAYAAAPAAYHASLAASYAAAGKNKDKKIKEYYENLRSMILNMSELEKLVYDV
jgi:hypothetical protein